MIFELVISLVIAYDFIPVVIFGEFTLTFSGLNIGLMNLLNIMKAVME